MEAKYKIGIIGLGFLGGAMDRYFVSSGINPLRYDKKGIGSADEVNQADIIFVCVNTPYNQERKELDLSYILSAVSLVMGEKIIVVRSTIPPGTIDFLQKEFPQHSFLFNPEFLRAKTAYEDFIKPPRQVVGYTEKSRKHADIILGLLPKAPAEYTKILPAKSAELLKYISNTMLAAKVALANKTFDFCGQLGIDYEEVRQLLGADPRIGHWGLEIMYEDFRGYNGTCFPKDVRTFISLGEKLGVDVQWLKEMDDANLELLNSQNLEPDYGYPKANKK